MDSIISKNEKTKSHIREFIEFVILLILMLMLFALTG